MKLISSPFLMIISTIFIAAALKGDTPTITARWKNDTVTHTLTDSHLRAWPIFKVFDESFFNQHLLPHGSLSFRYDPAASVDTAELSALLEELIREVQQGKGQFTHFTILRDRTFNKELVGGSLVLKFNDYPFVAKLFMENPCSFISPFQKGWESYLLFLVGGINHHLAGFTRIKNMLHINELINKDPYWSSLVGTPRKWFWIPENPPLLEITGYNFDNDNDQQLTTIPAIYCIIADAIQAEKTFSYTSLAGLTAIKEQANVTIKLCDYLGFAIDPNLDNFIIEKDTKKIIIIDTEHYPTLAGITHKPKWTNNYSSLMIYGAAHYLRNIFFGPKTRVGVPFDMSAAP